MSNPYLVATRYVLLEHARDRLALGLLLVFVPLWFMLVGAMIPDDPVGFKLMSTGTLVRVNGHDLTLITAGLNWRPAMVSCAEAASSFARRVAE